MELKIGDKEYTLKYSIRCLFVYERIVGTSFVPGSLTNEYILLYSVLIANNEDFTMSFNNFIDYCDTDHAIFPTFRKWFVEKLRQIALLTDSGTNTDEDKKKL